MTKILFLEITCCNQCPYLEYDFYYDMHSDSGWDCNHSDGKQIIDEGELKALEGHDGPKLPADTVPDWCPLSDRRDIVNLSDNTIAALLESVKCPENV